MITFQNAKGWKNSWRWGSLTFAIRKPVVVVCTSSAGTTNHRPITLGLQRHCPPNSEHWNDSLPRASQSHDKAPLLYSVVTENIEDRQNGEIWPCSALNINYIQK